MSLPHSRSEELGIKVRRAQQQLEGVRGVGRSGDVIVEVDAENRIKSLNVPGAQDIIRAYLLAVQDKQARVDVALADYLADPTIDAVSMFINANRTRATTPPAQQDELDWEEETRQQQEHIRRSFQRGW